MGTGVMDTFCNISSDIGINIAGGDYMVGIVPEEWMVAPYIIHVEEMTGNNHLKRFCGG
jgi:hypothetical protein